MMNLLNILAQYGFAVNNDSSGPHLYLNLEYITISVYVDSDKIEVLSTDINGDTRNAIFSFGDNEAIVKFILAVKAIAKVVAE